MLISEASCSRRRAFPSLPIATLKELFTSTKAACLLLVPPQLDKVYQHSEAASFISQSRLTPISMSKVRSMEHLLRARQPQQRRPRKVFRFYLYQIPEVSQHFS